MSGHGPPETSYMWRDEWLTSSGDMHTLHSHHAGVIHSWKQRETAICILKWAGVFIGNPSSKKWVNSAVLQTTFLLGTHTMASLFPMSPFGATLTFGQGMRRQWAGLAHGLTQRGGRPTKPTRLRRRQHHRDEPSSSFLICPVGP